MKLLPLILVYDNFASSCIFNFVYILTYLFVIEQAKASNLIVSILIKQSISKFVEDLKNHI